MSEEEMLKEIKSLSPSENAIETMLIKYKNLKKELEKEKEKNSKAIAHIELAQKDIKEELDRQINIRMINEEYIEKNYISKDKIKAKIEELDKAYEDSKNEDGESFYYYPDYTIRVLQSLLEKE